MGTTIPLSDGLVAASLCKDDSITYHLKEESGLSDERIRINIFPKITHVFDTKVGTMLEWTLLLRIFDAGDYQILPQKMVKDVKLKYACQKTELDDG